MSTLPSFVSVATRGVLAGLLFVLGIEKFVLLLGSARHASALFSDKWLTAVAGIELILTASLLVTRSRLSLWSVLCFGSLLLVFALAMVAQGATLTECGCFGRARLSTQLHLGVAVALIALAASGLTVEKHEKAGAVSRASA